MSSALSTGARRLFSGIVCLSAIILTACASMVLDSYVGKSLLEPVLDYGAPSNVIEMSGNRRAFIWNRTISGVIGGTSSTDASVNFYGDFVDISSTTRTTPAQAYSYECSYVLIAERVRDDIEGPESWNVLEYRQPRLECE